MKFNNRLQLIRKEKKLSRAELADMLGISYSTVAKYESGTREPDLDTLEKISIIFNVTTDYLLGKSDKSHLTEVITIESMIEKIAKEFTYADLMFNDLANMTVQQLEEVYQFIKFKRNQKEN
ncbi:helix-turn-helix domain-containing protein [Ornithinibacillus bavariensis]|uniref:Transcriptional regulator n=1 Tax=Ornithinibacillus bavariensis TaxID=545502 RepID=A0A919X6P6_9BACI|nr:helix-turn-helix transcriptional regulator [Ornithinibacillus bavariensis]GIO25560.1 transcriptional regulator [Ornithinibacillus bavariensis]